MFVIKESKLRHIIRTEYMKMMIESLEEECDKKKPRLPKPGKHKMTSKKKDLDEQG